MPEKLNLTQFKEMLQNIQDTLKKEYEIIEQNSKNPEFNEEEYINEAIDRIFKMQEKVLSYDLSDIPFEAWEGYEIFADENHIADFSKTKANIDFKYLNYRGYGRFQGCNVRNLEKIETNLNPQDFDEHVIAENPTLFLSDIFPLEFQNKYYSDSLTIDDLASLTSEQFDELQQKDYEKHINYSINTMIKILGLKKMVSLYRQSSLEYEAIEWILKSASFGFNKSNDLLEKVKTTDVKEIKNICFDYERQQIIEGNRSIGFTYFPELFKQENADLFLLNVNIPQEVKDRYFRRNLSIQDLLNYKEAFQNMPIDNFMNYSINNYMAKFIKDNYGLGEFQKLVYAHSDVFLFIEQQDNWYSLSRHLEKGKDAEQALSRTLLSYLSNDFINNIQVDKNHNVTNIPQWLSSMNFKFIDDIHDADDLKFLLENANNTIITDSHTREFINELNIDNIKKFEEETHFLSDGFANNINIILLIRNYLAYYSKYEDIKIVDFNSGNLSYEEFANQMATLLNELRQNRYFNRDFNYGIIEGKFRTDHPDIFLDKSAPTELYEYFYEGYLTPELLSQHKEWIPFLHNSIASCFNVMDINLFDEKLQKNGHINFYDLLKGKSDFETLMKFALEYQEILKTVRFELTLSRDDDFLTIQRKISEAFERLIIKGTDYSSNISPKIIADLPTFFLEENVSLEIRNKFYGRIFTIEDFNNNPQLLEIFGNTNIICGMSKDLSRLIPLFANDEPKLANQKRLRVLNELSKVNDEKLKDALQEFLCQHLDLDIEYLSTLKNLLNGLSKYDKFNEMYHGISSEQLEKVTTDLFEIFSYSDLKWVKNIFRNENELPIDKIFKISSIYKSMENDERLQSFFQDYMKKEAITIPYEKIDYVKEILRRLSLSNSSEIYSLREQLATQILETSNPFESLSKIEEIFIKNNLPTLGKIYSCFDVLHPGFKGFNFESSMVSPILKETSARGREMIVFADLVKSFFGSNNRSIKEYLANVEYGSNLYASLRNGEMAFSSLSDYQKEQLIIFSKHLATLYNKTKQGNKENYELTGDILGDIFELTRRLSPDGTLDYNLADRVIKMFCGFTGIDTLEEAKAYVYQKVAQAEKRNLATAEEGVTLEPGDFVKGITDIKYLRNILQNGSVSKEYLGAYSTSDLTPLDTDGSLILDDEGTLREKLDKASARGYGDFWFVLKNNGRFQKTRTFDGDIEGKRDYSKLELFYTGSCGKDHYGIRTGFASSEIDYILVGQYDKRIGLEIAMNGFYIPVADKEGKIVFTPEDYKNLRDKMAGLSYYGTDNYTFSSELVSKDIEAMAALIAQNNEQTTYKRNIINKIMEQALSEVGLNLKTNIGDLTLGVAEFIDTGSTGRGTNVIGKGDFDFMLRLDKEILLDPERLSKIKETILKHLGVTSPVMTADGDFRLKDVQVADGVVVDIDISFRQKTDKVAYSTDMAIKDCLDTIKRLYPEQYDYVVANILEAKRVLKEAEVYKPNRGEVPQGGLGGIGIENWILQNRGSFVEAIRTFLDAAQDKSYDEFCKSYQVWDFGDNFFAEAHNLYPHDNFVAHNMSKEGYEKMVTVLQEYLKKYEEEQSNKIVI